MSCIWVFGIEWMIQVNMPILNGANNFPNRRNSFLYASYSSRLECATNVGGSNIINILCFQFTQ